MDNFFLIQLPSILPQGSESPMMLGDSKSDLEDVDP